MSEDTQGPAAHDEPPEDPSGFGPQVGASLAERYSLAQKAEGILAPVLTAVLAFFVGGLVVLVTTGKNPLTTYKAIFDGSGLNWLFPWVTGVERQTAALNFQQTLLIMTPLILTALAVAFAFRCELHRTYVGSVERGERNVAALNLRRAAEALGVPLSSLFEGL